MTQEQLKPDGGKAILTTQEAAAFMGVSMAQMYRLTMLRQIPYSKPTGKICYFRRTDLEDFMMSNPIDTADQIETAAMCYNRGRKEVLAI